MRGTGTGLLEVRYFLRVKLDGLWLSVQKSSTSAQGWRIKGFEGARTPPRRQKHPLEIKEKIHKTLRNTKIQQKHDDLSSNQSKSMIRTAKIRRYTMN